MKICKPIVVVSFHAIYWQFILDLHTETYNYFTKRIALVCCGRVG